MDKEEEVFLEKWKKVRITIWITLFISIILSLLCLVFLPENYKVISFLPVLLIYFVAESLQFCPKCNKKIIYTSSSCKFCGIKFK